MAKSKAAVDLVTEKVPIVSFGATLADVSGILFSEAEKFETIDYIFVVDAKKKLKGVFSIKNVFKLPPKTKVASIMKKEIISARPRTPQERVALLAIRHDLKVIPVVEASGLFLGAITADEILDILHRENVEDDLLAAGISPQKDPARVILRASSVTHIKKRLPWLIVGLLGGLLAAFIVNFFEGALSVHIILAAFIPLVVYMADAVGGQAQTLYIRSLALERSLSLRKYVLREIKVGLGLALILGFLIVLISFVWIKTAVVSLILGFSIFMTILVAMMVAILMPWIFSKKGLDPAIASGPFATVVRDVLSLIIYFGIAQLFLFVC